MRMANLFLFSVIFLVASSGAAVASEPYVPAELEPWKGWVLHDAGDRLCPPMADNVKKRACLFPSRLSLDVGPDGAAFVLQVRTYAENTAAELPYAKGAWPEQTTLDGRTAPVADRGGVPVVFLTPGEHVIQGRLSWMRRPETLHVGARTGLVELVGDGRAVPMPDLSPDGRLRLAREAVEKRPEDRLETTIFRRFTDSVPAVATTLLRLEVSGMARRLVLKRVLPEGAVPMAVRSPVPLSFGPDGTVNVQASPGRIDIEIKTRFDGPVDRLGPLPCPYGPEIWSFDARRDLRVVEVRGPAAVDPATTDMPEAWKRLPAYLVEPGGEITFAAMHRGAAEPGMDDLSIVREMWLDFTGGGLSVRDRIGGALKQGWTLGMPAPGLLGRVTVNGEDRPVVLLGAGGTPGVELRDSNLDMTAESRYEAFSGVVPATGWSRDFKSVSVELNLPPGRRLLAATGPDEVRGSWIGRWDLLNIFLTLVMSLAALKLRGPLAGGALFLFLVLAWHEAGSPVGEFLFFLAALALVEAARRTGKPAADSAFGRVLKALYAASLVVLLVSAVPFVFQQLRCGVYPQLEPRPVPYSAYGTGAGAPPEPMVESEALLMQAAPESVEGVNDAAKPRRKALMSKAAAPASRKILRYDPYALVQTGPGMPDWSWRRAVFSWNGPVSAGETVRVLLVSPGMNLALAALRVLLLGIALYFLGDWREWGKRFRAGSVAVALLGVFLAMGAAPSLAAEFPPQHLLDELRERVLAPDACFPDCLASPGAEVRIDGGVLTILYGVDASARAAVPLPIVSDRWTPQSVVTDAGGGAPELFRANGGLWLAAPKGVHRVVLRGPVPEGVSFDLSFPLAPKKAVVHAPGWTVTGLTADGAVEGSLKLSRAQDGSNRAAPTETYEITPFLEVKRTLVLGLTWEVVVRASRLTPPGEPVVVEIPLLPGESVLDENVEAANGRVLVSLKPDQKSVEWRSRLDVADTLALTAPKGVPWVETWVLDASAIWNVEASGVPPARLVDGRGRRRPLWRPWPGETETLVVTRPQAAPGQSMTIESVRCDGRLGDRLRDNELVLDIRASKGERRFVTLPQGAAVETVEVDGRTAPWSGGGENQVGFAVTPGKRNVRIVWRDADGIGFRSQVPEIDLGRPAVNVDMRLSLPRDRWVLFTGGDTPLGPVVLFWSWLAALAVVAFGLGFASFTPLTRVQWLLLGLGLTQVGPYHAVLAVAWILALGARAARPIREGWFWFDLTQVLLAGLTVAGLVCLYAAVETGLLGIPRMQVAGAGSTAFDLAWTWDRTAGALPRPFVVSVPMYVFRIVMLTWSLWLAWSLVKWLKWGVAGFGREGMWRRPPRPDLSFPRKKGRAEKSDT